MFNLKTTQMRTTVLFFFALFLGVNAASHAADPVTKNIIVVNGGVYGNPNDFVTVTAWDPQSEVTRHVATIFTHSVQGLLVHEGYAYVAAQDSLARINIDTGAIEAITGLVGVNKMAIHGNHLLVSRQFPVNSGFLQARNKNDLSLVKTFPEVSDESWDITVLHDTAYVSVAGGWDATTGKLAVIDMNTLTFVRETDLGEPAVGIGRSLPFNNMLVFVCKTPWGVTSGTILRYNPLTTETETLAIPHALGKAAGIHEGKLFLVMDGNVGTVDVMQMAVDEPVFIQNNYTDLEITSLVLDQVDQHIYVNYSYWIPPDGIGVIYDINGAQTGTYAVGVSAEEVAADYRTVSLAAAIADGVELLIYPNPTSDYINLQNIPQGAIVTVLDMTGSRRLSLQSNSSHHMRLDLVDLPVGIYIILVEDERSGLKASSQFVKK
jgi:hypothetical protein